jgi:membrane-bound ClpP family serine protease
LALPTQPDPKPAPSKKTFRASITKTSLPPVFVDAVRRLEASLSRPVWMLIHPDGTIIDGALRDGFLASAARLPREPIALLVRSPGGIAKAAYQIARLLRRHCTSFAAVIPTYAKSGATLLSLGSETIIMGENAELGPLDVQFHDAQRERKASALDEVQALQRLNAEALAAFDQAMGVLVVRTRKKVETLLPHVLNYAAQLIRPLAENIDVVQYTQRARLLKVAEEYAVRLLQPYHGDDEAREIAMQLVQNYPEHDFYIDADEARQLGLHVVDASDEQSAIFDTMKPYLNKLQASGHIEDV